MLFELVAQSPIDSLAGEVGTMAGGFITVKLAAGMGIVSKFLTDLVLKVKGMHETLPKEVKPFVALAVSTGLVFLNKFTFQFGGPEVTNETMVPALVAWGVGMGFHSLLGAFKQSK